jgi:hypothetical protein
MMEMDQPLDAKADFRRCGTCSQTFAHILNREFGHNHDDYERALDPLAGGIMRKGHQCGMLWGASLAVGAEATHRTSSINEARTLAITATQGVVDSFVRRTNTVNCKEITGVDQSTLLGLVKFMVKTLATGMDNSLCFNLAEAWAPEAIEAGKEGLEEKSDVLPPHTVNCATLVAEGLGASEEEATMVAGFAGGLGLSGKGCGALATAIWYKSLQWCRENPGKTPPMFINKDISNLIETFEDLTKGELECQKITGKDFLDTDDHAHFISSGGCAQLIHSLIQG